MFTEEDLISQCGRYKSLPIITLNFISPTYVAPEVLMCKKPYDQAVDMWAIGVVCYVM
jgi:serine/threonine protein kinase